MVLQTADMGDLNDRTAGWRLRSPRDRRILVQREVRAALVIIVQEESERATKGPLIPDDDMIETECRAYCYAGSHQVETPLIGDCQGVSLRIMVRAGAMR